ncbi:MAG: hypothetical protein HY819_04090 [Acidobacteria bacterium]|nr:hypothetical protein [Acidobacteriota bacterium]
MKFINKTSLSETDFLYLISTIPKTTSLMDLMVWGKRKNSQVLDVVKLDEYTFDVIMPLEKLFLVPDVT